MNSPPLSERAEIEHFEHVQKRICLLWGTHELDAYINHLLTDTRDGQRKGFPLEVTAELLFLAELNKLVRAIDLARKLGIPLRDAYHKIDKQDRGLELGDTPDPLSGRDQFAREGRELGARGAVAARAPERAGVLESIGKGLFALLTSKVVLFLIVLYLAWQFLLPVIFKQ